MKRYNNKVQLYWHGKQKEIEYKWVGLNDPSAPLMVFLHEGLGSLDHWQQWPDLLCHRLGYRGLVYSRYGYGHSTARARHEQWLGDYLHIEAHQGLPALLRALDMTEPFTLLGHSDGATIALLYAASAMSLAKEIIVIAPHIYIEAMTHKGVQKAIEWYEKGDLKRRLGAYHADPDSAFGGWAGVWGDERYVDTWNIESELSSIHCPVLAIQGENDEYASLDQIYDLKKHVPQTQVCVLAHCRHSPHIEMPDQVAQVVQTFLKK